MTQSNKTHSQNNMTQLIIFPYAGISTENLETVAYRVIPPNLRKKTGKSESRMRSYLAGRSIIAWYFVAHQFPFFVAPNQEYGYLQLYDSQGQKIPDFFVNISHTEEIVAVAFGAKTVGVDIESSLRSAMRVLPRVASERERAWVEKKSHLAQYSSIGTDIFLWSAKEAFSKALGLGMKFGFRAFQIFESPTSPFPATTDLKGPLQVEKPFILLETYEKFLITICTDEKQALTGVHRRILTGRDFHALRQK